MVQYHKKDSNYIVPDNHQDKLIEFIVGFEMQITRLEGQFKLGQNHNQVDQDGVLQGLLNQKTHESLLLADFIQSINTKYSR